MNRSFSSQDDASSYLDLQSAMVQNEQKEKLLRRMVEQQVELQQLQERQKVLLDAQQRVSKMDLISTQDLEEKLDRLQTVKQRITTLQCLLDDAEASAEPLESTSQVVCASGAGDSAPKGDIANASSLVNDQLEDLYVTVTNLLADIDKMNVLNDMADKQRHAFEISKPGQRPALEMAKPSQRHALEMAKPDQRYVLEMSKASASKSRALPSNLDKSLSPLPHVKLVESSEVVKSRLNLTQSSDGGDTSLVERHYYAKRNPNLNMQSPSESSFDEAAAMHKPVHELWQEMRRYQSQLAELQERRRELSLYLKESEQASSEQINTNDERFDDLKNYKQTLKVEPNLKMVEAAEKRYPTVKYFGDIKSANVDASTERTNATWGGSTSTSGDESEGSISPPPPGLDATDRSVLSQLPDYVETAVCNLWQELEYHNSFLQLLLDDQKALSVLLENTLSMQKDHHSSAMYGISPDFLIYQLDNCSAQIMVYRKQIVLLHKDLMEIQKQYPSVDVSYGYAKSSQSNYLVPKEKSSLNDSCQFSPRKISQSNISTPSKYYTTENTRNRSPNDSFDKIYQAYQRSPTTFRANESNSFKSPQVNLSVKKSNSEMNTSKNLHLVKKSPYVSITKASQPSRIQQEDVSLSKSVSTVADRGTMTVSAIKHQHLSGLAVPDLSDVDSNASGYPLFEALRDTIYSEAATLISQNEARPHFLIELFHELQQLNSDYLRQHCLFVIRDVVNGYIIDTPKGVDGTARKTPNSGKVSAKSTSVYTDLISSMKPLYSENTPSDSEADSERENLQFCHPPKVPLQYDYALDVSNASALTTPISSQEYQGCGDNNVQNPFESDFLGSTVIHLDEALQRVREIERMKQEKKEQDIEPNELEKQVDEKQSAQLDAQKLDVKIKEIINKVIPVIKSGNEVCGEEKIEEISSLVSKLVANERLAEPKGVSSAGKSDRQLQTVLKQCLNKFLGYHLSECGEEIIIDTSEVLFNELAYIYMIEDYEEVDEDENKVDEAIIQTMVEEECSACDQDSQSVTSDLNDESSSSFSSSNTESKDEDENANQNKQKVITENITVMEVGDGSVIVDLSRCETKPLTSYGSGEDEEAGSGEEYDQYKESEDVPTSMQNDKVAAAGEKKDMESEKIPVNGEK